jgi:hypothetical protein
MHKVRMELDTTRAENAFSEDLHTELAACDTAVARLDERVGSVSDQAQGDNA